MRWLAASSPAEVRWETWYYFNDDVWAHLPRPATQWTATQQPGSSLNFSFSRFSQSSTIWLEGGAPSSNGQSWIRRRTRGVITSLAQFLRNQNIRRVRAEPSAGKEECCCRGEEWWWRVFLSSIDVSTVYTSLMVRRKDRNQSENNAEVKTGRTSCSKRIFLLPAFQVWRQAAFPFYKLVWVGSSDPLFWFVTLCFDMVNSAPQVLPVAF